MQALPQPEELAEAHDQRPPLLRVDAALVFIGENALVHVRSKDPHLGGDHRDGHARVVFGERSIVLQRRLELNRAFKFCGVFELASKPSIAVHPRNQTDDIGAMFTEPSSLTVLISATGVPM